MRTITRVLAAIMFLLTAWTALSLSEASGRWRAACRDC